LEAQGVSRTSKEMERFRRQSGEEGSQEIQKELELPEHWFKLIHRIKALPVYHSLRFSGLLETPSTGINRHHSLVDRSYFPAISG
jgi:hypothetical protein